MENNGNGQMTQENLEKIYQQQTNMFFAETTKYLKGYSNIVEKQLNTILKELINPDYKLDVDEYKMLGSISFLYGIDFATSKQITKEFAEKIKARFAEFEFSNNVFNTFNMVINTLKNDNIIEAKDKMKEKISSEINIDKEELMSYKVLIANINSVIGDSVYPVNMAIPINELKTTKKHTYQNILKLNSLLQQQCEIPGTSVKKLIKIYDSELFQKLLNKAIKYFDNQKFAVIYYDAILSIIEKNNSTSSIYDETNVLAYIITDENQLNWDNIEAINAKKDEFIPETTPEVIEKTPVDSELINSNPAKFISLFFEDYLNKKEITENDIFDAITGLIESNDDYTQHIFTYLRKNMGKFENFAIDYPHVNYDKLITKLNNNHVQNVSKYEELVKLTCAPIEKKYFTKIVNLVNNCIESLILISNDEKQYLISQLVENQITTFKHLQQILGLIENAKILGDSAITYVNLYEYLNGTPEILAIFEKSKELNDLTTNTSIFHAFLQWMKAYSLD